MPAAVGAVGKGESRGLCGIPKGGGKRGKPVVGFPLFPRTGFFHSSAAAAFSESSGDVKRMLAESMAEVRTGRMDPKLGTTLAYMGVSLLKAIETSDFEKRLEKLEHGLKKPTQETGTNRD
jgi:hypothetical protein